MFFLQYFFSVVVVEEFSGFSQIKIVFQKTHFQKLKLFTLLISCSNKSLSSDVISMQNLIMKMLVDNTCIVFKTIRKPENPKEKIISSSLF